MITFEKDILDSKGDIKIWVKEEKDIDDGAFEQLFSLANLPFIFRHVSAMADVHKGYGMPIGGVVCSKDGIIPSAVGYDIGCSVSARMTSIVASDLSPETIKRILEETRKLVPVGFNRHREPQNGMPDWDPQDYPDGLHAVEQEWYNAEFQIGTMGSNNHFIELQADEGDRVWIMIHSGSRKLGHSVGGYYMKLAQELNKKWYSNVPPELAFLPEDSNEGQAYVDEMGYCLEYAKVNHQVMMSKVMESIVKVVSATTFNEYIYCRHNFARKENHYGHNVWVMRKGATSAKKGETVIIPGSQGKFSYIGKGKGERESYTSCSHGAGRTLGRKQAERELNLEKEVKYLEDQGIIHSLRGKKSLGEADSAYKDIEVVMDNQKDLVEPIYKLRTLGVIKG